MDKVINIDGKNVKFTSNGALILAYRMHFNKDIMKVLFPLIENILPLTEIQNPTAENIASVLERVELTDVYNIVWTLAKLGNPQIDEPLTFYSGFSQFPILEVAVELLPMVLESLTSNEKIKKKLTEMTKEK